MAIAAIMEQAGEFLHLSLGGADVVDWVETALEGRSLLQTNGGIRRGNAGVVNKATFEAETLGEVTKKASVWRNDGGRDTGEVGGDSKLTQDTLDNTKRQCAAGKNQTAVHSWELA